MARPRACDACSLRKVRCTGSLPCPNCSKAGFKCSFKKTPRKSGPKGPRHATRARVSAQLQSLGNKRNTTPSPCPSPFAPNEGTDWRIRDFSNSPLSSSNSLHETWKFAFSIRDVFAYLEIYTQKMYPVWPVIDSDKLSCAISADENDHEAFALAFAVCAGTGAQLQLKSTLQEWDAFNLPGETSPITLADRFAAEAEKCRSRYDYRESSTTESILIPLFLHFYYGAKEKRLTASFLLRESVSLCQIHALDKEETYQNLDFSEESYRRRTFWLLYVTERGHAMQHGTPICLTKSISLPSNETQDSQLLEAFHSLVELFASVDGVLVDSEAASGKHNHRCSRERLVRIQHELRRNDQWPMEWNETQRSDVSVTQQWLRMLVWQLSLSNVTMSSEPGDDSMSFAYPAHVSRDALRSISTVSFDALVAHGPGMVSISNNQILVRLLGGN